MISEIPRKSLQDNCQGSRLDERPSFTSFFNSITLGCGSVKESEVIVKEGQKFLCKPITLGIDETGNRKKGKSTDYTDRQYIGNLGKIDNGIVDSLCLWCFEDNDLSLNE